MRRLMAALYDWLLVIALMMVLSVPLVAPGNEAITPGNPFYRLGLVAIIAAFFVGFWVTKGQTLGMRAWRLQITNVEGNPVTLRQAALRFACICLSVLPLGLGAILPMGMSALWLLLVPLVMGFFWVIVDSQGLSCYDRWSGTRIRQMPKTKT